MTGLFALLLTLIVTFAAILAIRGLEPGGPYPWTEPQGAPFLGGGSQEAHAWQRYHVRYYPMALLFVAFEMEMMFMYPWAVVFVVEGLKAMMEMGMFLSILAVGIVYAWREGVFRWQ